MAPSSEGFYDRSRSCSEPRRGLSTYKAGQRLGWRAQVGLEDGPKRTIDWHEAPQADAETRNETSQRLKNWPSLTQHGGPHKFSSAGEHAACA